MEIHKNVDYDYLNRALSTLAQLPHHVAKRRGLGP